MALLCLQATHHSVNGMYLGVTDSNTFLLTAGSDMRIRYWDLSYPANSHIVAPAASDPVTSQTNVSYRYVFKFLAQKGFIGIWIF